MRKVGRGCVIAWLALLAGLTHQRAAVWQSDRTLWTDAVRMRPLKPRPWINLGQACYGEGQVDHAAAMFAYAERLSANPARPLRERQEGTAFSELNLALIELQRRDAITECLRVSSAHRTAPRLAMLDGFWASWHCAPS